jgi:hypothetical protein
MLSPMPCVNVNTDLCTPHMCAGSLPVQLASSHLHPTNLHGTVSLASVCARAAPAPSPHVCSTQLGWLHLHPPHATHSPCLHPVSATAPSRPGSVLSQRADTKEAQEVQHGREGTATRVRWRVGAVAVWLQDGRALR